MPRGSATEIAIEFVEQGKFVRVEICGRLDVETAREASRSARELADATGAKRFLVIMQNVDDHFSDFERYAYMAAMTERGYERHERFALVFSELDEHVEFTETVAVNRGFSVRVFDDVAKAEAWIRKPD